MLGHDPARRIICVSYGSELATKLANDFRAVVDSPWYRQGRCHVVERRRDELHIG